MIVIPQTAIKAYEGKSKDVYDLGDGTVILDFNKNFQTVDPITGEPDPGANHNGKEEVPGLGRTNLALTTYFFEIFSQKGISTHLIKSDIENGLMHVKKVEIFGNGLIIPKLITIQPIDLKKEIMYPRWTTLDNAESGGIEVIARRRLTGSYHRAFKGAARDMMGIDPAEPAFVEFSIKNDDLDDPRIMADQILSEGIMSESELEQTIYTTQEVERIAQYLAKERGIEIIDFKIECGKYNGHSILADEFATGSWRTRKLDGQKIDKFQTAGLFLGEDVVSDIRKHNLDGLNEKVKTLIKKAS